MTIKTNLPYILHIESTTSMCSVAISKGNSIVSIKEFNDGYTHAENLHVFINELLLTSSIKATDLAAVSVSSGPGSYTGLRIGYSTAKGLAYGLNIPLIIVDTLKALTSMAIDENDKDILYCPMIDARRMEVFTALHDTHLKELIQPNAMILDENSIVCFDIKQQICFFGDGMSKAHALLQTLPNAVFKENIMVSSAGLVNLAFDKFVAEDFADVAYAEPFYLKDFFFTVSKKIN